MAQRKHCSFKWDTAATIMNSPHYKHAALKLKIKVVYILPKILIPAWATQTLATLICIPSAGGWEGKPPSAPSVSAPAICNPRTTCLSISMSTACPCFRPLAVPGYPQWIRVLSKGNYCQWDAVIFYPFFNIATADKLKIKGFYLISLSFPWPHKKSEVVLASLSIPFLL